MIKFVNNKLNKKFHINFILKFYNWLSEKHTITLNNKLQIYYKIKSIANSEKRNCVMYYINNFMLKFNCEHNICYECYDKINK